MRAMKTVIIDDEPLARKGIQTKLSNHPSIELIGEAHSSKTLKDAILYKEPDLILLDIMLRDTNSIEVIKTLPKIPLTILTTAYNNHALNGFSIKAIDYLMKPISEEKLFSAVYRAYKLFCSNQDKPEKIIVKSEGRYVQLLLKEILFIQGMQNYVIINTLKGKVVSKITMKAIMQKLSNAFIQIHRSYIVNRNLIDGFERNSVYMQSHEIPIGKTMRNSIYSTLLEE